MTRKCNVCGGETRRGTRYTARCDDKTLVALPSIECASCGAIVRAEHQLPTQRYAGDTMIPPPPRGADITAASAVAEETVADGDSGVESR
jgi:hypothetical protein